jgi:hypothetical protein
MHCPVARKGGEFLIGVGEGQGQGAFQGEEPFFQGEAAAVADEVAGRTDDAVARDYDRNRIGAIGGADGADGFGGTDGFGDLQVASGLPVRNAFELAPDAGLEGGALEVEHEVEMAQAGVEIGGQLACGFAGDRVGIVPFAFDGLRKPEMDGAETQITCNQADGQIIYQADFGPLDHGTSLS